MVQELHPEECPPDEMAKLVEVATQDDRKGLARLETLLGAYDGDARLHFLRGSLLAAVGEYDAAQLAMQRAVDIAPGYGVARFQLGLLELSSGDAAAAMATLKPLETLPPNNPLHLFARGLQHLVVDEFESAIEFLRAGIAENTDNPAMSADMRLIIEQAEAKLNETRGEDDPVSAAHFLLQQYSPRGAKH